MLTSVEGEKWAEKLYLIGDALAVQPLDEVRRLLAEMSYMLNSIECPKDISSIFEKYIRDTSKYELWNEIMQLQVESAGNYQTLDNLIDEMLKDAYWGQRELAFEGQGLGATAYLQEGILQDTYFTNWRGLIQYLASVFQGEIGTPRKTQPQPSQTDPSPTSESNLNAFQITPNLNDYQITPNQAHPPLIVPIMNGPGSELNPFSID